MSEHQQAVERAKDAAEMTLLSAEAIGAKTMVFMVADLRSILDALGTAEKRDSGLSQSLRDCVARSKAWKARAEKAEAALARDVEEST